MIKDYVTISEAALILEISETTVYRLVNSGSLNFLLSTIGNAKIVKLSDLEDIKPVQMSNNTFKANVKKIIGMRDGI